MMLRCCVPAIIFESVETATHDQNKGYDEHNRTEELRNVRQSAVVVEIIDRLRFVHRRRFFERQSVISFHKKVFCQHV